MEFKSWKNRLPLHIYLQNMNLFMLYVLLFPCEWMTAIQFKMETKSAYITQTHNIKDKNQRKKTIKFQSYCVKYIQTNKTHTIFSRYISLAKNLKRSFYRFMSETFLTADLVRFGFFVAFFLLWLGYVEYFSYNLTWFGFFRIYSFFLIYIDENETVMKEYSLKKKHICRFSFSSFCWFLFSFLAKSFQILTEFTRYTKTEYFR